jgi:hypothetical protein
MVLLNLKWPLAKALCLIWRLEIGQGHQEHTKDHHNKINHVET